MAYDEDLADRVRALRHWVDAAAEHARMLPPKTAKPVVPKAPVMSPGEPGHR